MPFCLLGCRGVILVSSISSSSLLKLLENALLRGGFDIIPLWVDVLQVTFLRVLCGDAKNVTLSFLLGMRNSATLCRLLGAVGTGMWRLGAVEQWRRPCQLASLILGTTRTLILLSWMPSLAHSIVKMLMVDESQLIYHQSEIMIVAGKRMKRGMCIYSHFITGDNETLCLTWTGLLCNFWRGVSLCEQTWDWRMIR